MHLVINNGYVAGTVLIWVVVAIALVIVLTAFSVGRAVGHSAPASTREPIARDWGKCKVCGGIAATVCTCRGGPSVTSRARSPQQGLAPLPQPPRHLPA